MFHVTSLHERQTPYALRDSGAIIRWRLRN